MRVHRLALLLLCLLGSPYTRATGDLLVLLEDTGETRDGLPVLRQHPGNEAVEAALLRGLSGTLLRVYRHTQSYLERHEGIAPEPAYLLLSERQGGFPREGFFLGAEEKRHVGYVDLHRDGTAAGRFGAMDQIFPHELAHVLRLQLAGPIEDGNTNQVHALGLRTDRPTAFNEGFAEHLQAMAIDDPDADPRTHALATDRARFESVERHLAAYRRELEARISIAPRMRMGFLAWYSNDEDVLRYEAVKSNAFARRPVTPERLLEGGDPYRAYLLESIVPGAADGPIRSLSRMISTEGVVSALFYRWATNGVIRDRYREDAFYEAFGTARDELTPLDNLYLKLMHVLYVAKPQDVLEMIEGYCRVFPDERDAVRLVAHEVLGSPLEAPDEIWLANPTFKTGTTLFDQYRGLPREHTFDLNAASVADLAGVPGVDPALARALIDAAPFDSIRHVERIPGVDAELIARFESMADEMGRLRAEAEEESVEEVISIRGILMPFAWRLLGVLLSAALLATWLHRAARRPAGPAAPPFAWWRSAINGTAASFLGLVCGWSSSANGLGSLLAVSVLCGIPAALICLRRGGRYAAAGRVLTAWFLAALPAALAVSPLL